MGINDLLQIMPQYSDQQRIESHDAFCLFAGNPLTLQRSGSVFARFFLPLQRLIDLLRGTTLIVDYYDSRQVEPGAELEDQIDAVLAMILQCPEVAPQWRMRPGRGDAASNYATTSLSWLVSRAECGA